MIDYDIKNMIVYELTKILDAVSCISMTNWYVFAGARDRTWRDWKQRADNWRLHCIDRNVLRTAIVSGLIFISRVICIALLLIWHHFYRYMRTWTLNICTKSCGHNMLTCYSYDLICKRVFCQHVVSLLNMILYEVWKPILKYIGQPNLEHTI